MSTSKVSTPDSDIVPAPLENCCRLVVVGSPKVGKTAIITRFLAGKFDEQYTPTIENFHRKIYKIRGQVYQLDILDTSGNHPFPAMQKLSLLTGDIFILVFSFSDRNSFQEVIRLRDQIIETKLQVKGSKVVPMVIAGNKCDLTQEERQVSSEEALKQFSNTRRCSYIETSAKKVINIDILFQMLFENAKLPSEMSPSMHRKVSISQSPTLRPTAPGKWGIRRRLSEACGVVTPNARRPSVRSDLMQLRFQALHGSSFDFDDEEEENKTDPVQKKLKKLMCCIS
ncbi:GTP-binding protein Rhes [Holothuria leucospilota]|uniref:GTP-binding protein Rhes n=1 Tax=Holothuria leucospilota TaxID=206669 RepID=A0A9Q1C4A3_HOLLE|nr:GTP-binding protein Rhes [Holothuria leucospilota]